jgi:hypothetical protein
MILTAFDTNDLNSHSGGQRLLTAVSVEGPVMFVGTEPSGLIYKEDTGNFHHWDNQQPSQDQGCHLYQSTYSQDTKAIVVLCSSIRQTWSPLLRDSVYIHTSGPVASTTINYTKLQAPEMLLCCKRPCSRPWSMKASSSKTKATTSEMWPTSWKPHQIYSHKLKTTQKVFSEPQHLLQEKRRNQELSRKQTVMQGVKDHKHTEN